MRRQREERAQAYFSENAAQWSELRSLHVDEASVEQAMRNLAGEAQLSTLVDLGTGTGRVLELFGDRAKALHGIDSSREMLSIARANPGKGGPAPCPIAPGRYLCAAAG
ncbi:MAG: class I SAM-dependent methyltransferase [Hyphomicrobiales bacterium]